MRARFPRGDTWERKTFSERSSAEEAQLSQPPLGNSGDVFHWSWAFIYCTIRQVEEKTSTENRGQVPFSLPDMVSKRIRLLPRCVSLGETDCAHFVLNTTSLHLIPAYSSQSSGSAQTLAAVGLSESE